MVSRNTWSPLSVTASQAASDYITRSTRPYWGIGLACEANSGFVVEDMMSINYCGRRNLIDFSCTGQRTRIAQKLGKIGLAPVFSDRWPWTKLRSDWSAVPRGRFKFVQRAMVLLHSCGSRIGARAQSRPPLFSWQRVGSGDETRGSGSIRAVPWSCWLNSYMTFGRDVRPQIFEWR